MCFADVTYGIKVRKLGFPISADLYAVGLWEISQVFYHYSLMMHYICVLLDFPENLGNSGQNTHICSHLA